jgi:hypothetical protein
VPRPRWQCAASGRRLEQTLVLARETVDARRHHRVDAGRNLDGVHGPGETIRTGLAGEGIRLHEGAHALLEEERIALRAFAQ